MAVNYQQGHKFWVRYAPSTAVISDTTGAVTAAPTPASAFDIGYTSPAGVNLPDGAAYGFASGNADPLYDITGYFTPSISFDVRGLATGEFLATYCYPAGELPYIDIFFGVSGVWTSAIYKCKFAGGSINIPMQEGTECIASVSFEGQAYKPGITPLTLGYNYNQFGPALLATDVRQISVGDPGAGGVDLKKNVMNLSVEQTRNVERKNGRENFGDNVVGSLTSYDILTHHRQTSANMTIHDLSSVESALFYGTATAKKWSDLIVLIHDITVSKSFDFTITGPRPTSRTQNAIESGAQMNFTIPIIGRGLTVVAVDEAEEEE